jgi:DNA-binding GntR family transcriptional regulator
VRGSIDFDAIPVNPALLDKGDIIVIHEHIDGIDQLVIADVWKQIRLHDSKFHLELIALRQAGLIAG